MIHALAVASTALRARGEPCEVVRIAGVGALVARPGSGTGPVVVFANAATPRGVHEPAVARFLGGLAAAGFVGIAPELPGVRHGAITPAAVEALVSVAAFPGKSVALIGASTGAGLALLAADDPRLSGRVSAVTAVAPFGCLRALVRLGTTGHYGPHPFAAAPLVASAAARSLSASAPDDPAVPALLVNRDPHRFDELFAALARSTRNLLEQLSPVTHVGSLSAPVELLCDPDDRFFPADEAYALARAGNEVRLTVTRALDHVRPRPHAGLVRVAGVLDRTLRRALQADRVTSLVLEPAPAL